MQLVIQAWINVNICKRFPIVLSSTMGMLILWVPIICSIEMGAIIISTLVKGQTGDNISLDYTKFNISFN